MEEIEENEEFERDDDYDYECARDDAVVDIFEDTCELFEAYTKHWYFKRNPDKIARHMLAAIEHSRMNQIKLEEKENGKH